MSEACEGHFRAPREPIHTELTEGVNRCATVMPSERQAKTVPLQCDVFGKMRSGQAPVTGAAQGFLWLMPVPQRPNQSRCRRRIRMATHFPE